MSNVPERLQLWLDVRKKYRLTDTQVQMARELGLKPDNLEKLSGCGLQEHPSLAECIEESYRKRFKKDCPDDVRSIEERLVDKNIRKNLKEGKSAGFLQTASSLRFRFRKYLSGLTSPDKNNAGKESLSYETAEPEKKQASHTECLQKQSAQRSEAEVVAKFWTSLTGLK